MAQRILFVLISHDRKGPNGIYLSEATHPHRVLAEAMPPAAASKARG